MGAKTNVERQSSAPLPATVRNLHQYTPPSIQSLHESIADSKKLLELSSESLTVPRRDEECASNGYLGSCSVQRTQSCDVEVRGHAVARQASAPSRYLASDTEHGFSNEFQPPMSDLAKEIFVEERVQLHIKADSAMQCNDSPSNYEVAFA